MTYSQIEANHLIEMLGPDVALTVATGLYLNANDLGVTTPPCYLSYRAMVLACVKDLQPNLTKQFTLTATISADFDVETVEDALTILCGIDDGMIKGKIHFQKGRQIA